MVSKLEKNYTSEDSHLLMSEVKSLNKSMRELEAIEPKSHHELSEKRKLLEVYTKEVKRIDSSIHSLQANGGSSEGDTKIQVDRFEDELLIEKAKELKAIEGYIIDINHMLKDCAETIQEQGKDLDTVENFVEISSESAKAAADELEKASGYQKGSNSCCYYLIGAGIVVSLILIIIVYM